MSITVKLTKIEFDDTDFKLNVESTCSTCRKAPRTKTVRGKFLTRLFVGCESCKAEVVYDIQDFILDTVKEVWGYDDDDIVAVKSRLQMYVK